MNESADTKTEITESSDRALARRQVEKKRKFRSDAVAFVVINAFLTGIWFFTGRGYFWPGWVIGGWGVAMVLTAWELFLRRPITEHDIDREVERFH